MQPADDNGHRRRWHQWTLATNNGRRLFYIWIICLVSKYLFIIKFYISCCRLYCQRQSDQHRYYISAFVFYRHHVCHGMNLGMHLGATTHSGALLGGASKLMQVWLLTTGAKSPFVHSASVKKMIASFTSGVSGVIRADNTGNLTSNTSPWPHWVMGVYWGMRFWQLVSL